MTCGVKQPITDIPEGKSGFSCDQDRSYISWPRSMIPREAKKTVEQPLQGKPGSLRASVIKGDQQAYQKKFSICPLLLFRKKKRKKKSPSESCNVYGDTKDRHQRQTRTETPAEEGDFPRKKPFIRAVVS